jgi:hypothetical protein
MARTQVRLENSSGRRAVVLFGCRGRSVMLRLGCEKFDTARPTDPPAEIEHEDEFMMLWSFG